MFKVKRIETGEIFQVLAAQYEENTGLTMFLIWDKGWKWRPAYNFVPPNYEIKEPEK